MQIRLATEDDANSLAELVAGFRDWLGRTVPTDEVIRASVRVLLRDSDTEFLVAEGSGGEIRGFLQQRYRLTVWTGADEAWLEDLYVVPDERRSGVGKALVDVAFERAAARNCRSIALDTNEENVAAIGLYESLGFSSGKGGGSGRQLLLHREIKAD